MLIYGVTNLPDITLSKYQAVEESGIESMLEAQTRLIRQLYRLLLLEKLLHITFIPRSTEASGNKLKIFIVFTN